MCSRVWIGESSVMDIGYQEKKQGLSSLWVLSLPFSRLEEASTLSKVFTLSSHRRHDSSGSGQSAFEPLVANGAPASLIPK